MSNSKKKESKDEVAEDIQESLDQISTKKELREYLLSVRDKMTEGTAAPVYALTAVSQVMGLSNVYELLDERGKEVARDIWFRIKQAGFQVKDPPLLFGEED